MSFHSSPCRRCRWSFPQGIAICCGRRDAAAESPSWPSGVTDCDHDARRVRSNRGTAFQGPGASARNSPLRISCPDPRVSAGRHLRSSGTGRARSPWRCEGRSTREGPRGPRRRRRCFHWPRTAPSSNLRSGSASPSGMTCLCVPRSEECPDREVPRRGGRFYTMKPKAGEHELRARPPYTYRSSDWRSCLRQDQRAPGESFRSFHPPAAMSRSALAILKCAPCVTIAQLAKLSYAPPPCPKRNRCEQ